MEKTCDYNICTGCGVCSTVCPTKCISFHTGNFGHTYPKIDTTKCIDCNNCRRVCPAIKDYEQKYPLAAYAGLIKNKEEYHTSTSGGAAQALSVYTIQKGGVVYGCATLPGARIEHIRVDKVENLYLLQGSKYVQSDAWKINSQLLEDVKSEISVVFIGTPCQCAAIKSLFKKQPDNLSLVELICHGVPSQKFLQNDLCRNGVKLEDVNALKFRTQKGFQLVALHKDNKGNRILYESLPLGKKKPQNIYYKTFFFGYSYRPSCYTCKFAKPERVADITIGDFWGLGAEQSASEIPVHTDGISVILPCTENGRQLLDKIRPLINLYERPVSEAIRGNHQLQHPTLYGVDIKVFNILRQIISIKTSFHISFFIRKVIRFLKKRIYGKLAN